LAIKAKLNAIRIMELKVKCFIVETLMFSSAITSM
jgi:hypothetical protein